MDEILHKLIQESPDSGPVEPFDFNQFMNEMIGSGPAA